MANDTPTTPTPPSEGDHALRDALSGFNAEDAVEDPDELEPREEQPPAATPDSPNPI
ncbi:MAG: hypothetical protein ACXV9S_03970 [Acidimicrobiia bacterium]